jgi:transposase
MARIIEPAPNPIISVPGLGPVITASLLADIVDISRLTAHKRLAQHFGVSWKRRSSGNIASQHTRLTKLGNPYGRYCFIQGTDKTRRLNLEYKAFYWPKYNEVTKYRDRRALALTARKLLRLVHPLLTRNQPYVRLRTLISPQVDWQLE